MAPRGKRRDPRAEPDSIPAMRAVSPGERSQPSNADDADAQDVDMGDAGAEARGSGPPASGETAVEADTATESRVASTDLRLDAIEPLFTRSAWKEIAEKLGPPEKAGELPPALGLVYALAGREGGGDEASRGATELAIASMAALLGVGPQSTTALVLAKRLLRQNPASWAARPAPPAKLSVAIILIGIAVGVAAGSFLSLETFRSFKLF